LKAPELLGFMCAEAALRRAAVTTAKIDAKADLVSGDKPERPISVPPASNRRGAERVDVTWSVDCETEDTFLYANITNISEVGIFVRTNEPLEVGTRVTLKFAPPGHEDALVLTGQVQWVNPIRMLSSNPNPGMGIRFIDLTREAREQLVGVVRTIAYVRSSTN
jgi:type IV pilus assembly protein PilZ